MMSSNKANSFGSFLQTMNAGKTDAQTFDRETSAKLVLQHLSSLRRPVPVAELGSSAGLTSEQTGQVIAYLADAGMVETLDGGNIALSGFGDDAMGVFAVS